MKIISYNLNGIRSAISKGLIQWLSEQNADIVCFQETKAWQQDIPVLELEALGYKSYWFSAAKKGYSGVGILTKIQPDHVQIGMGMPIYDQEGRFIRADYGDVSVVSVYHPSGSSGEERQNFKFQWMKDFQQYIDNLRKERPKLIISGDYNICHKPIDIHNPVGNAKSSGFLPEERAWLDQFITNGFVDSFRHLNPQPHQYTWWSFRMNARARNLGWRIDYHLLTENLKPLLKSAAIHADAKHSDHCPIEVELDF
ncbi:MAG: exodeoxyribonuclease III [Bacteroidia bacterium]|nr:exodeoxyribonuclease III [Bacteroidia bacterium]